jgi:xylulokinase
MAPELLVGVDLGTTAVKAGLFDADGRLLAVDERPYAIQRPRSEWAEQHPHEWMAALAATLELLAAESGGRGIAAVGICSQVNTHVFVDADGGPLRPAIIWQDQRCSAIASELNDRLASNAPGKSDDFNLSPSSLPCRAEWVRRNEPDTWAATYSILSPKDFVTNRLCRPNSPVTDPITPFDLVDDSGAYDPDVVALVGGVGERLPVVHPIDALVGPAVADEFRLIRGAPVVTGTMDAWGSVYGSGLADPGDVMEVAGTSEILGLFSRERHRTPGVVSFPAVDGLHLHAGPTQAGGAALAWFASLARLTIVETLERAEASERGAGHLLFMPHLLGERAPLWDSAMRGAFIGLSSEHTLADLCRAVLEGVAYSARHLLEELEHAGAIAAAEVRASGGGAQSDLWCQIKADVLDRRVARLRVRQSGCLGAALMAASGARLADSVREAAHRQVQVERVFEPDAARGVYDELYSLYRDLHRVLKPTHAALAALRRRGALPSPQGAAHGC